MPKFIVFSVFLLLIGFLSGSFLGLYQDATKKETAQLTFSTEEISRTKKLARKLRNLELANQDLETEIALLNHQIHLMKDASDGYWEASANPVSLSEAQKLKELLGSKVMEGEGLEITLHDSDSPVLLGDNPNLGIVHNVDLLLLINQLWASGARAIAINQQRIVERSDISCAGPVVLINKTRVTSPFVIQVIGPADELYEALQKNDSYLKYLSSYGIPSDVQVKQVLLPAYPIETIALEEPAASSVH
jgi:uncharacterized protein YlxW (UPF0749 family)